MVEIKNKGDSIVRRTLWNAYNRKCFYCNNPIPYNNNYNVDHIIPESIGNEEAIKLYDLQEDFELNSYLNLVPTCFVCNSKKSDKKFEKQHILFYINIAKKTIPKIIKLEKVIREKDKKSEVSAIVNTARNELKVHDILTIIKNQQIAPYQGKLLEGVIKKISKLDIDKT